MSNQRQWWPQKLCDEWMPPGLASPDDFIVTRAGALMLDYPDGFAGVSEGERRLFRAALAPGDIVNFVSCDELGTAPVRFDGEGGFTVLGDGEAGFAVLGAAPADFNVCFADGNTDWLAETLEALAAALVGPEHVGAVREVSFARWSEGLPHKLICGGGGAQFIAVSAVEARQ